MNTYPAPELRSGLGLCMQYKETVWLPVWVFKLDNTQPLKQKKE
jgi:hypothetical protein